MKNKMTVIILMVLAMPFISPFMPKAEAGFLEERLAEVAASNTNVAQVEELIKMKDYLAQDNNRAAWLSIAQAALERSEKFPMISDISQIAGQFTERNQNIDKERIANALETAMRTTVQEKLQSEVSDHLSGYQQQISLLSALLSNNDVRPAAEDNNPLGSAQ